MNSIVTSSVDRTLRTILRAGLGLGVLTAAGCDVNALNVLSSLSGLQEASQFLQGLFDEVEGSDSCTPA